MIENREMLKVVLKDNRELLTSSLKVALEDNRESIKCILLANQEFWKLMMEKQIK